jgi:cell division protein FtsL
MDTFNWISLIITVGSIAISAGIMIEKQRTLEKKMDRLEAKVDKHNNFDSRIARCEESTKSAHHRIDEIVAN